MSKTQLKHKYWKDAGHVYIGTINVYYLLKYKN